ncbi:MAG: hypothetical protein ACKVK5_05970 [Pseudomonadales bacterium]
MSFKLFPSDHEKHIFITIISFCFGAAVGLLPELDGKTIAGVTATLVAAFAGAFFAYKFNADRENQRKQEIDLASANKAIFTLVRVYNYVGGFNNQFIKPFVDNPGAYFAIQPSLGNSNPDWKLDYDSISFLISENKSEILTELTELEELFIIFTETVRTRNHIHINIVQPAMESAGIVNGTPVTLDQIDGILGDRTASIMKSLTTELIEISQRGEENSERLIQKLHKIMVDIFPGKNVIRMEKLNTSSQGAQETCAPA